MRALCGRLPACCDGTGMLSERRGTPHLQFVPEYVQYRCRVVGVRSPSCIGSGRVVGHRVVGVWLALESGCACD
jgi:hypothetical protein